jgi:ATP adenylyltransferase
VEPLAPWVAGCIAPAAQYTSTRYVLLLLQTSMVRDELTGLTWIIRLATALKAKPTAASASNGRNPFLPPEPALTVGPLSDTHTLVLNKFNVVEHHVLVSQRGLSP